MADEKKIAEEKYFCGGKLNFALFGHFDKHIGGGHLTGWQGHQTLVHTPTPTPHTNMQKSFQNAHFSTFQLDHYGRTKPLTDLRVHNYRSN